VRYVPLGGLTANNAASYLQDPLIAAIGGSWIAPRDVIKANDWEQITASARAAQQLVSSRKA
jgi:2-dehydro-3-deoxyphosphogluconate aldolase/(4S)-4-hydroxy-2-oxoglutarate aldolase